MSYKAIVHVYGRAGIREFNTFEEALSFKEYSADYNTGFVQYILDHEDIITEHGFKDVMGVKLKESPIGKKYDIVRMKIV